MKCICSKCRNLYEPTAAQAATRNRRCQDCYNAYRRAYRRGERAKRPSLSERLEKFSIPVAECGCHIWLGQLSDGGYGRLRGRSKQLAHRASFKLAKGPIPQGFVVCHTCDIRCCINPDHLFLGTLADNMQDMVRKGRKRTFCGEQNYSAKLTSEKVNLIRSSDLTCTALAKHLSVSISQVARVRNGESWRHVPPPTIAAS